MSTQKAVILPVDFSSPSFAALPWAKRMSVALDATIHCIYVVEEHQVYSMLDMPIPVQIPSTQEISAIAAERLSAFANDQLQGLESSPQTKVLLGKPAAEIVAYADEAGAEIIVMATHGHSGIEHVLLGSTTEAVLRHSKCPVLSIPGT